MRQVRAKTADHLVSFTNDQVVKCAIDYAIGRDASQLRFVENRLRRSMTRSKNEFRRSLSALPRPG